MDAALHSARVTRDRRQIRHEAQLDDLPEGVFILWNNRPHLLGSASIHPYTPEGYEPPLKRPSGPAAVLTPAPSVTALRHGYKPQLHQSASV